MTNKHIIIMQPAGSSPLELDRHTTTRSKQIKKCPSFEVLHALYSEHPSVKAVRPMEVGSIAEEIPVAKVAKVANTTDDSAPTPTISTPPASAAVTAAASSGGGAAACVGGAAATPSTATKTASSAAFSLKPSKLPPKMDLGNAYLEAQVLKEKSKAEASQQDMKVKIMMSLITSGKTFAEITEFMKLL